MLLYISYKSLSHTEASVYFFQNLFISASKTVIPVAVTVMTSTLCPLSQ